MKPPHKNFFSSLKQVEKRLKLDHAPPPPPPSSPPQTTITEPSESPLYLHNHTSSTLPTNSSSQPPQEFLSIQTPPNKNDKHPFQFNESQTNNDVGSMVKILGLCDIDGRGLECDDFSKDEFYDKVVKVKGPKCKLEVERLDGWISYFSNSGEEPLRLAHLLLAKAAFVASCGGGGEGEGVEFPCTVDEFLSNDPPLV